MRSWTWVALACAAAACGHSLPARSGLTPFGEQAVRDAPETLPHYEPLRFAVACTYECSPDRHRQLLAKAAGLSNLVESETPHDVLLRFTLSDGTPRRMRIDALSHYTKQALYFCEDNWDNNRASYRRLGRMIDSAFQPDSPITRAVLAQRYSSR